MVGVGRRLMGAGKTVIDLCLLLGVYWLAFLVRFEGELTDEVLWLILLSSPWVLLVKVASLGIFGVRRLAWRFVGLRDVRRIFVSLAMAVVVLAICRWSAPHLRDHVPAAQWVQIPLGVLFIDMVLGFVGMVAVRVCWRLLTEHGASPPGQRQPPQRVPTILIGTGRAGALIAKEIVSRRDGGIRPVGFVGDDGNKVGMEIHGIPVLGTVDHLEDIVKNTGASQALIAMANGPGATIRRVVAACERCGIAAKIIPDITDIVEGKVHFSRVRDVAIEDVLRREPVQLDSGAIGALLRERTVMVTGAGGSIGSEICRQVLKFNPKTLVLVERAEHNLFTIDRQLRPLLQHCKLQSCIADVLDRARMSVLFEHHRPEIVFHAAAHKHVPVMEANPGEAVKNNVFGTKCLVDLAHQYRAHRFVMISTDKAVNPSSVMGTCKRIAERYVHAFSQESQTQYVVVRFGNVLGSAGSVIPIFQEQIRRGGPITITHAAMERFFMTIPEASQLVLQAAAMGRSGEIFVLDMGEPVKIVDLAREMIRLAGLRPGEIEIAITGLRPGEKLFEECYAEDEQMLPTRHPKVFTAYHRPSELEEVQEALAELQQVVDGPERAIRRKLKEIVPEYACDIPEELEDKVAGKSVY